MRNVLGIFAIGLATCWPTDLATAADFAREKFDETGFVSIFDGRTLSGWHVSAQSGHSGASKHKSGGRWVAQDGAMVGSQDIPGNGGIILTDKPYGDFEIALEMNNDFVPDSGLFLRSTEQGQAYQYMIDYHAGGNLAGIYGEGLSGGISVRNFDFTDKVTEINEHECPFPLPVKPAEWPAFWKHGQWNHLRAKIVGNPPKITSWINGVRFMEFADSENRHPDAGGIGLQIHGGGNLTDKYVRYRNIRVKVLQ
jgi:hypothetical protein